MRASLLILALPFLLPLDVAARSGWASGTYVYADLCTQAQTGGLAGRRIVLRRSPIGNGVTYEAASGSLANPVSAESLFIDPETTDLAFTIDGENGRVSFRGMADATVLTGTLTDGEGERPLRLRRVLRSHEREACRTVREPETTASTE